jgi:hypothetical protein
MEQLWCGHTLHESKAGIQLLSAAVLCPAWKPINAIHHDDETIALEG